MTTPAPNNPGAGVSRCGLCGMARGSPYYINATERGGLFPMLICSLCAGPLIDAHMRMLRADRGYSDWPGFLHHVAQFTGEMQKPRRDS